LGSSKKKAEKKCFKIQVYVGMEIDKWFSFFAAEE